MASPETWICNEIPKNKKYFASLGKAHESDKNNSSNCDICGLLKESSIEITKFLPPKVILAAIAGFVIVVGSGTTYNSIANRCEVGLEKMGDLCIDPFLQPYQQATQQGDKALLLAKDYKSILDLQKAHLDLNDAVRQLTRIPQEALIYPETVAKFREYQESKKTILNNLDIESSALNKLQESEKTAEEAKAQTIGKKTFAELKLAKEKWSEAITTLDEIKFSSLVIAQAKAYRLNYEREIQSIDRRLAAMAKFRSSRKKNTYELFKKTYTRIKKRNS